MPIYYPEEKGEGGSCCNILELEIYGASPENIGSINKDQRKVFAPSGLCELAGKFFLEHSLCQPFLVAQPVSAFLGGTACVSLSWWLSLCQPFLEAQPVSAFLGGTACVSLSWWLSLCQPFLVAQTVSAFLGGTACVSLSWWHRPPIWHCCRVRVSLSRNRFIVFRLICQNILLRRNLPERCCYPSFWKIKSTQIWCIFYKFSLLSLNLH